MINLEILNAVISVEILLFMNFRYTEHYSASTEMIMFLKRTKSNKSAGYAAIPSDILFHEIMVH